MPSGNVKYTGQRRLSRYTPPLSRAPKKPPKIADELGARIRAKRLDLNLTQEDVATACGVTKSAVSQWESGECDNIKLNNFKELLTVLETNWDYLVFGVESAEAVTTAE